MVLFAVSNTSVLGFHYWSTLIHLMPCSQSELSEKIGSYYLSFSGWESNPRFACLLTDSYLYSPQQSDKWLCFALQKHPLYQRFFCSPTVQTRWLIEPLPFLPSSDFSALFISFLLTFSLFLIWINQSIFSFTSLSLLQQAKAENLIFQMENSPYQVEDRKKPWLSHLWLLCCIP